MTAYTGNSNQNWVMDNYNNPELERQAIEKAIDEFMLLLIPQHVVNDAIISFRIHKIDENNPVELNAKKVLIELTKTKYLREEQKRSLLTLLVQRAYPGYEIDYSYIFDRKIA